MKSSWLLAALLLGASGCGRIWFSATDATPDAMCGADQLRDDFDDNVQAGFWAVFQAGGATISELGGRVVVTPPTNQPADAFAIYASRAAYVLRDHGVFFEIPVMVNTSSDAEVYLSLEPDVQHTVQLMQSHGMLYARKNLGSGFVALAMTAYQPVAQLFWRVREQTGTTYWETAPDGGGPWATLYSEPTESFVDPGVLIKFGAHTYQAESNPGSAQFDDLNGGGGVTGCL